MSSSDQPPDGLKPEKEIPANLVIPPKKEKLSKAERRALQEQQRAAKAARQDGGGQQQTQQKPPAQPKQQQPKPPSKSADENKVPESTAQTTDDKAPPNKEVSVLSHLPPYRDPDDHPDQFFGVQLGGTTHKDLHPYVLQVGRDYATGRIRGGNAECRSMFRAFQQAIHDYEPPSEGDLRHVLQNNVLKPSFTYFTQDCRPHSVAMGNAFTFIKSAVATLDREASVEEAKSALFESMEAYIQERINFADKAIAKTVEEKIIVDGDVILTYANAEVISVVLKEAAKMKKFRVIVVDSKPLLEGKILLHTLREAGLDCTYILLNALSFVMKEVTKILLGAEALMNDGSVYGRIGTACVAMSAKKNLPVLVCGETYKISNRIQLESITMNELGNPKHVLPGELGDNLRVINLLYDLTPAKMVTGVVTEMGILPPTSVSVLLREMNPQEAAYTQF